MEKIENASQNDDVIVLGIASVETQGIPGGKDEPFGRLVSGEIFEE